MRIVVTGATGYVGRHVVQHALESGMSVVATHYQRAPVNGDAEWVTVDIANPTQVDDLVRRSGADAIVHAAAAMNGSLFPQHADLNWRVNAVAAVDVARAATRHGMRLVHISSDAIFSGRGVTYTENDQPDPIWPYGAAKAAAELGVATVCPEAAIVRPSIVHGDGDDVSNRERLMLDVVAGRTGGVFFTDEIRCPVGVNDLARACVELVRGEYAGVLNTAGSEAISLHELACLVALRNGYDPDCVPAGTHAEYGLNRPQRLVLDSSRAAALLTTRLRGIGEIMAHEPSTVAGVNP